MNKMEKELTPVRATAFKGSLFDEILKKIDLTSAKEVLELACGSGWLCYKISEILEGSGRVVGLDISKNAINIANKGLDEFPFSNIEFIVKDVHTIEYAKCFDYVIAINALHHFADRVEVFKRVKKSLRSGGRFLLIDYNSDSFLMRIFDKLSLDHGGPIHFLNPEQVEELYRSQEFHEIEIVKRTLYGIFSIMIGSGEIF